MGRPRQAFALTPVEAAALDAAEADFLVWRAFRATMERAQDDTRIAAAGAASRDMVAVLEELERTPELSALVARMQDLEHFQAAKASYRERLEDACDVLQLLVKACRDLATDGRPPNHYVHEWIRCAARHWRDAGLPVKKQGRFAKALGVKRSAAEIPVTGDRDAIGLALALIDAQASVQLPAK